MECIELSPVLVERANKHIQGEGPGEYVTVARRDLNRWSKDEAPGGPVAVVIANQILHHVVNLEGLFDNIAASLGAAGILVTADMIGRNGHMRWPEALALVNWNHAPDAVGRDALG